MKYVLTWRRKRHGTTAAYETSQARVLDLLRGWQRPGGVAIHEFVLRTGESGGYAVFETEDPAVIDEASAVFADFNFRIDPVLDINVALSIHGTVMEWRDAPI